VRSTLFLAVAILLGLGLFFARDRVRLAFQVGAVLYAITLVIRFLIFGVGDADNVLALVTIVAGFFLVWLVAWWGTNVVLRRRERTRPPRR
jgi:hypothetical protein